MKASELRLGNCVLDRGGKVLRIDQWGVGKVEQRMLINGNQVHPLTEEFEYINPIPLTEEWLVKFGFTDYEWCSDCAFIKIYGGHLMVRLYNGNWHISKTRVMKDSGGHKTNGHNEIVKKGFINYVHQLQNLYFALTGKELELKEDE